MAFPPATLTARTDASAAQPNAHAADHTEERNAINDTVSEVQSWTVDRDANTFDLLDVGQLVLGSASATTGAGAEVKRTETGLSNVGRNAIGITDAMSWSTGGASTVYSGLVATPTLTIASGQVLTTVTGLLFQPTVNGSGTMTTMRAVLADCNIGVGTTTAIAIDARVNQALGTLTTGIGVDISFPSQILGTTTTAIGLRIATMAEGTTKWGMQVGDFQSFHEGNLRVGAIAAADTTAPAAKLDVVQPTIGSEVQRLTSVATGDDVQERVVQGQITTTNATPATIITVANPASTTVGIDVAVVARRTGGSAGSAEDGAFFRRTACFKNSAGTATEIGADGALSTQESQAGYDVTVSGSSGNIVVQVTGIANTNMTWHATARVYLVSS